MYLQLKVKPKQLGKILEIRKQFSSEAANSPIKISLNFCVSYKYKGINTRDVVIP